jgi:N-acetylneuraminic acid mutarotase
MKTLIIKLILSFYLIFYSLISVAQNTWTKMANFPGQARYNVSGFTIGHYIFEGLGINNNNSYSDFYKWNQETNTWTSVTSYPGGGTNCCLSFSCEGKGYIGLGNLNGTNYSDLYSYDTTNGDWSQMASLPGLARYAQSWFVIGHKVYVIGGSEDGAPYLNDVWVYDTHENNWSQLRTFPGGKLETMAGFTIGNHGYIGGGWDGSNNYSAFWKYDTTGDSWTSIPSFPNFDLGGIPRAFVIDNKAYLCDASNASLTLPVGYAYDTITEGWSEFTNMGHYGIERSYSAAYSIGYHGYVSTGIDSLGNYLADLWQYNPTILNLTASNTNFCVGDSVHFEPQYSGKAKSWLWSFGGGSPAGSDLQNPSVTYTTPGNYTVKLVVTDSSNVVDSVTYIKYINVLSLPSPIIIDSDSGKISCQGTTSLKSNYVQKNQWYLNGTLIKADTSQTIFPEGSGFYSVKVTDGVGCVNSSALYSLALLPSPIALVNCSSDTAHSESRLSGNCTYCAGSFVAITAGGGGTYSWSNGDTSSVTVVSPLGTATYTVTVTSSNGCNATATLTVTINPLPPVPTILQNGNLLASSSSMGNQWYLNGNLISGEKDQFYSPSASGFYAVQVTGSDGCSSTSAIFQFNLTGINEYSLQNDGLSIYPNPSQGILNLNFASSTNEELILNLFNTLGELVYSGIIKSGTTFMELDLPHTSGSGLYSLLIQGKSGARFQKNIVLN